MNASHPIGDSGAPCPHAPHSGVIGSVFPYAVNICICLLLSYICHRLIPSSGNPSLLSDISFANFSVESYAFEKSMSTIVKFLVFCCACSIIIFFIISGCIVDFPVKNA